MEGQGVIVFFRKDSEMLSLTVMEGQRVYVGKHLEGEVYLVSIDKDRVKLGFDFPPHIRIAREKVVKRAIKEMKERDSK